MRFNTIAAFFALSAPIIALAGPSPQTTATPGSLPVGSALAIINSLQTTIQQYESSINSTIVSLSPSASPDEKAAASQVFGSAIQAITTAINDAVGMIGTETSNPVSTRDVPPGTLEELVPAAVSLVNLLFNTISIALPVLDLSSFLTFILQLFSALTSLLETFGTVVEGLEPLLVPALNLATSILGFVSSILRLV